MVALLLVAAALFFLCNGSGKGTPPIETSSPVSQVSDISHSGESNPSASSSNSDVQDWVTLAGTIRRDEQTTAETGMGWSRVVYFLELGRRTTIVYKSGFGDVRQADVDRIAIKVLEQFGDDANKDLDTINDASWESFVGMRATVTGQPFDSGNAHTVGPVMLVNARTTGGLGGQSVGRGLDAFTPIDFRALTHHLQQHRGAEATCKSHRTIGREAREWLCLIKSDSAL